MFNPDYLPDRLDIHNPDSIAYFDFIESKKIETHLSIFQKILSIFKIWF